MTAYLVFGAGILVMGLLLRWHPSDGSFLLWCRNYFLVLIGAVLFPFGLAWLLRRSGHPELAAIYPLFFLVLGVGTALGALFRPRAYWSVASVWGLFAHMPERIRQGILTVCGLLIAALGVHSLAQSRAAFRQCGDWYASAAALHDSVTVSQRVPDPTLHPPRGRFEDSDPPPLTCGQITRSE